MVRGAVNRRDGDPSHMRAMPEQIQKIVALRARYGEDKTEKLLHTSAVTIGKLISGAGVKPDIFERIIAALDQVTL